MPIENTTKNSKKSYTLVNFCELDKYAEKSYCAVHGADPSLNLGDITKVDETKLEPFNMICGGSPCFVEGTLVLTDNGYVPVECIQPGDLVMTHQNRYKKVLQTMIHENSELIGFKPSTSEMIFCTKEHPIYIRKRSRVWDNKKCSSVRVFDSPMWVKASDLNIGDYVGTAINTIEELPQWDGYTYYVNQYKNNASHKNELSELFHTHDFWYFVGRYIGDGWLRTSDGKTIIVSSNDQELPQITSCLDKLGFNYCIVKEKTANKIHIVKKELFLFLTQFGHRASNKHLTKDILNLPIPKLRSFLDGYISSDGTFTERRYKITSTSRQLIYEIGQCVAKAYKKPFSIYFTARPKIYIIEGRVVNQRDSYQICWKLETTDHDRAFYEDGYIWSPVTKIMSDTTKEPQLVYNLEVADDNSYVVQNVIVHNCQDFSIAGKNAGSTWKCKSCGHEYNPLTVHYSERDRCPNCGSSDLDKTRSSLLVEWLRVIRANKPKCGIYENVKNLVGKNYKDTFQMFLDELHEYGYNAYYQVLNAKDYGVPQSRERIYLIIILKELDNGKFQFPKPFESDVCMKDLLEDQVDEKFYMNTPKADELIQELISRGKLNQQYSRTIRSGGEQPVP